MTSQLIRYFTSFLFNNLTTSNVTSSLVTYLTSTKVSAASPGLKRPTTLLFQQDWFWLQTTLPHMEVGIYSSLLIITSLLFLNWNLILCINYSPLLHLELECSQIFVNFTLQFQGELTTATLPASSTHLVVFWIWSSIDFISI